MDHIEVTTSLDVATAPSVLTRLPEDRGFRVGCEEDWSARASRPLRSVGPPCSPLRARLTLVQVRGNATGRYYFGGLWGGLWSDRYTDRIASAGTAALDEQERTGRLA